MTPDLGRDAGLALGDRWLRDSSYPGERLIVLYAANMVQNAEPLAHMAMRYTVVSPQTSNRPHRGGHAVLAVWASGRALELAEELASPGGGLCLIPGSFDEVSMWVTRTKAVDLANPDAGPAEGLQLDPEVMKALSSMLSFDGHNRFRGAGGKEYGTCRTPDIGTAYCVRLLPGHVDVTLDSLFRFLDS